MIAKRKFHTRLICNDFHNRIRPGREYARMQRSEWIPFLGEQLKALAMDLDCALVDLWQVVKSRDRAESSRPTMSDLPFDGGDAADEIYALWRRELDMPPEPPGLSLIKSEEKRHDAIRDWDQQKKDAAGQAEFIALKRRFGPLGIVPLRFIGPRMLLSEINHEAAEVDDYV